MSFVACVTLHPVADSTAAYTQIQEVRDLSLLVARQLPDLRLLVRTAEQLKASGRQQPLFDEWSDRFLTSTSLPTDLAVQFRDLVTTVRDLMVAAAARNPHDAGLVRAAVLELIIYHSVADRYQGRNHCQLERGCQVHVDGSPTSNTCPEQSVDVAGWHNGKHRGEVYEVKSQCDVLTRQRTQGKLQYLERLAQILSVQNNERVVAVVSWEDTRKVSSSLQSSQWPHVRMYGRQDLLRLRAGPVEV